MKKYLFIILFLSFFMKLPVFAAEGDFLGEGGGFFIPPAINNNTAWSDDEKFKFIELSAKVYRGAKVKFVRFHPDTAAKIFSWGGVEDEYGAWKFIFADKIVGLLNQFGIEPIITVCVENPKEQPQNQIIPKDVAKFKEYLKLLVERYDGDGDFGLTMGSAYPDINGSGEVNTADWEALQEDKIQWAKKHIVRFFEIERPLDYLEKENGVNPSDYVTLVKLSSPVIRESNKNAKIFLSPINLKDLTKGVFNNRYGFIKDAPSLVDGATLLLFFDGNDLSVKEYSEKIKEVKKWFNEIGGENLLLWIGGVNFGAKPSTADITNPTKGFCNLKICSEKSQAEQIVKIIFRSFIEGYSKFLYYGFMEEIYNNNYYPYEHGGVVHRIFNENIINVRASYAVFSFLSGFLSESIEWNFTEIPSLPPNTYGVKGSHGSEEIFVLWYDWSREVGKDEDYTGLKKEVKLTGLNFTLADITQLYPDSYDIKLSDIDFEAMFKFSSYSRKVENGNLTITLERAPFLIRQHGEAMEEDKKEIEEIKEIVEEKVKEGGGKCGCNFNGSFNPSQLIVFVAFIIFIIRLRNHILV